VGCTFSPRPSRSIFTIRFPAPSNVKNLIKGSPPPPTQSACAPSQRIGLISMATVASKPRPATASSTVR
jgi:hypothetical protein